MYWVGPEVHWGTVQRTINLWFRTRLCCDEGILTLLAWRRACGWAGDNCMCQGRAAPAGQRWQPGTKEIGLSVSSHWGHKNYVTQDGKAIIITLLWKVCHMCIPWITYGRPVVSCRVCIPWIIHGRTAVSCHEKRKGSSALWQRPSSMILCRIHIVLLLGSCCHGIKEFKEGEINNFNFQITENLQLSRGNKVSLHSMVSFM